MLTKEDFDRMTNEYYWCAGYNISKDMNPKDIDNDIEQYRIFYTFMSFDVEDINYICYITTRGLLVFTVTTKDADENAALNAEFLEFAKTDKYKNWIERSSEILENRYDIAEEIVDDYDQVKELRKQKINTSYISKFVNSYTKIKHLYDTALSNPKQILKKDTPLR